MLFMRPIQIHMNLNPFSQFGRAQRHQPKMTLLFFAPVEGVLTG